MISEFADLWKVLSQVLLVLCIGMGTINLFCGYRYYVLLLILPGFVIGGLTGWLLGSWMGGPLMALLASIIFALVGALVSYQSHNIGVFMIGATGGGGLGLMIGLLITPHFTGFLIIPCIAFSGVICGLLAVSLNKTIIVVSTALQGAISVVFGTASLLGRFGIGWIFNLIRGFHCVEMLHALILLSVLSILLAIFGIKVQFDFEKRCLPLVQY